VTISDLDVQGKPPVGAAVRFYGHHAGQVHEWRVGIVWAHPAMFPAYCVIRTEQPGTVILLPASALHPTTPDDAWDVHVLSALLCVSDVAIPERTT
jgi:hypothetical protein